MREPSTAKGRATREKILAAAAALFAEKGLHGVDSKAIARRARVSVGAFYLYFKDKNDLFCELAEGRAREGVASFTQALDQARELDSATFVLVLVRAFMTLRAEAPGLDRAMEAAAPTLEPVAKAVAKAREAVRRRVAEAIEARPDLNAAESRTTAALLQEVLDAAAISVVNGKSGIGAGELLKGLADMVSAYLITTK